MNKNLKSNKSNRKLPSTKKEVGGPKDLNQQDMAIGKKKEFATISSFFPYCLLAHQLRLDHSGLRYPQ